MALEGSERELMKFGYGQYDHDVITDTAEHTGLWYKILVVANAGLTALVDNKANSTTAYDTLTLPAGAEFYGEFTTIQLSSGSVVAYKGPGY